MLSLEFARAGATIVANYVRGQVAAEALLQKAKAEGLLVIPCRADLTSDKGLDAVEGEIARLGEVFMAWYIARQPVSTRRSTN